MPQSTPLPEPESASLSPSAEANSPTVLVVAADPARRAELAALLTGNGIVVWQAESGLDGLSTFFGHTGDVDAILLDTDLSDLSGPTFLRRLRTHFPGVPCVFLSDFRQADGLEGHGTWAVPRTAPPAVVTGAVSEAISFSLQDGVYPGL